MFGKGQRELGDGCCKFAPDCPCLLPLYKDILRREKSRSCICFYEFYEIRASIFWTVEFYILREAMSSRGCPGLRGLI